jgi:hypothetical protein
MDNHVSSVLWHDINPTYESKVAASPPAFTPEKSINVLWVKPPAIEGTT